MNNIPPKIRKQIDQDNFYKSCALFGQDGHVCEGRVTMEHAIMFAGSQLQELWAIVPICSHGHGVDEFQDDATASKELRVWVALNRATNIELGAISKVTPGYIHERERLNAIYGQYEQIVPTPADLLNISKDTNSKKQWYLKTDRDNVMIEKIRAFKKRALGYNAMPNGIVSAAIENYYMDIGRELLTLDQKLYEELGFDK